jgi:hypothetical protein
VKSGTSGARTPGDTDSNAPDVKAPTKFARNITSDVACGSPLPAMVSAVNETVLGLSPAVTLAGTYLGAGLASQLGFFSSANQYQHHSAVSMAATAKNVSRLLSGAKKPENPNLGEIATSNIQAATADLESAVAEAENSMHEEEIQERPAS